MAEISCAVNELNRQWSATQAQWENTKSTWRDHKGSRFEREHWSDLEREVGEYLSALEEIAGAIQTSRQKIPD